MVTIDFGLLGTILSVAGVVIGVIVAAVKLIQRLSAVERRLDDMAGTFRVLCKGVYASLDGLHQQGCNGMVTETHKEFREMLFGSVADGGEKK
ncbi:MAG: hypothetical protein ACI4XW_01195 [Candidatus Spyradocola sp.]